MSRDPSEVFHESLLSEKHPSMKGRLTVGDDFDGFVVETVGQVNEILRRRAPSFHFDFIEADDGYVNAVAFCSAGWKFVGVTLPLFREIKEMARRLAETEAETAGREVAKDLIQIAIMFIVGHEVGHHELGHVDDSNMWLEYAGSPPAATSCLISQAQEIDADLYSVGELADLFINDQSTSGIVLIRLLLVAIGMIFLLRQGDRRPPAKASDLDRSVHPPPALRFQFIWDWLRERMQGRDAGVSTWLDSKDCKDLLENCALRLEAQLRDTWNQWADLIDSPDGREYVGRLRQAHESQNAKQP